MFWIVFHSLHEVTFLLAIIFCWRITWLRKWLVVLFVIHIAVRIWTVAYFAPTIIEFQHIQYLAHSIDPILVQKSHMWQTLNYLRVAVFMAISFALVPLLYRLSRLQQVPAKKS